jgi:transcriptional regulator with XRE-family HTH domain
MSSGLKQFSNISHFSETERRRFEQSLLRLKVSGRVANLIDDLGISQAELARRLGRSRPWVSKVLSGRQNLTLDSLADIGWALGVRWDARPTSGERTGTPAVNDVALPLWITRPAISVQGARTVVSGRLPVVNTSFELAGGSTSWRPAWDPSGQQMGLVLGFGGVYEPSAIFQVGELFQPIARAAAALAVRGQFAPILELRDLQPVPVTHQPISTMPFAISSD